MQKLQKLFWSDRGQKGLGTRQLTVVCLQRCESKLCEGPSDRDEGFRAGSVSFQMISLFLPTWQVFESQGLCWQGLVGIFVKCRFSPEVWQD